MAVTLREGEKVKQIDKQMARERETENERGKICFPLKQSESNVYITK